MSQYTIKSLYDQPALIPELARLWQENIGKIWAPTISIESAEQKFATHANKDKLPLALVALDQDKLVGMASLRITDGIRPELTPWLGGLVVDPEYRSHGLGKLLIDQIKYKAKSLGFAEIYLLAFDPKLPKWYESLGWEIIGQDNLLNHPVTVMKTNTGFPPSGMTA